MRQLTGSKLNLATKCLHFTCYGEDDIAKERAKSATEEGTIQHEAAEQEGAEEGSGKVSDFIGDFLANGQVAPKIDNEKTKKRFEGWKKNWPLYCPPGEKLYEPAFSYDPFKKSFKFLGTNIKREYPKESTIICCSLDVISYDRETKTVYVIDHKTGMKQTPCAENWQMIFGAICAFNYYDQGEDVEKIVAQLHYIDEDGKIEVDEAVFDYFFLHLHQQHLNLLGTTPILNRAPNPGDHCLNMYCDAVAICPATRQAAAAIVPIESLLAKIKSPEQLAKAVSSLEHADRILKLVKNACKTYCDENGGEIVFPDGSKYSRIKVTKSFFKQATAIKLLGSKAQECYAPSSYFQYKVLGNKTKEKKAKKTKKLKEKNND